MAEIFKEEGFENLFVSTIKDLGYDYVRGSNLERSSTRQVLLKPILKQKLALINPKLSDKLIEKVIYNIEHIDQGLLVNRNRVFFEYLQNGMEISYYEDGKQKTQRAQLIDYENIDNNSFIVSNQVTITGKDRRIPDVLVYVNGLPLVVIELKSMQSIRSDYRSAFRQIRNYMKDIEELFVYNAFNIVSDFSYTKIGTLTAGEDWYKEWKSTDGEYIKTKQGKRVSFDTLLKGVFPKERFLDLIRNFIFFENSQGKLNKILAQYHQYFAVKKAVGNTVDAIRRKDGRGGVFWHTQGSGKSLSMVFYVRYLTKILDHPSFVILTDRNNLDDQLFEQFAKASDFLRQSPIQAKSRKNLHDLLDDRVSNGIFFSTMQKFAESDKALTLRSDVIVISDEAHRSQYGLRLRMDKEGNVKEGMARLVRKSLPNATYIGFTGTPISQRDKDTREVFGSYIDIYDMSQSVNDGATRPVFYENRVLNLGLDDETLEEIDKEYEKLSKNASEIDIEESKRKFSKMEEIVGSDKALDNLVSDMVSHYEKNRAELLSGKAMLVAYNREIAIKIYKKILKLRPSWDEKVKVIVTSSNNDPEEWKDIIGHKKDKKELANRFRDNDDPFKIAIVVDMWLTGFNVPSLHTLYIYKPMQGHNLMQAIARVNRVYKDKTAGLVVDYIGIASALKEAIKDYTPSDKKAIDNANIRDSAYPIFKEKLELIEDEYLRGLDYGEILNEDISPKELSDLIEKGLDHILSFPEKIQDDFRKESKALKDAHSISSSITSKDEQIKAAFIEVIRNSLNRIISNDRPLNKFEINKRIGELIKQSIVSGGVINLFKDFDHGFNLFDKNFIEKLRRKKEKNLSIKLLEKLIKDKINKGSAKNLVSYEKFSDKFRRIMKRYKDLQIENAEDLDEFLNMAGEDSKEDDYKYNEIIDMLVELAKDIENLEKENKNLGLNQEELAFYHAISKEDKAKDFYSNDELIKITKELTKIVNKEMTPDWTKKKSGKAAMKRVIRRLLTKYDYPKDIRKNVIKLVAEQAEFYDLGEAR